MLIKKNREYIDLIEIHNGRNISKDFSYKQNKIAEKYKIKKIYYEYETVIETNTDYWFADKHDRM